MNNAYEDKNGDLTLLNVQTGDAGAYICQATNSYGTANSVVTLLVHGNSTYISKGTCSDHLVVIQFISFYLTLLVHSNSHNLHLNGHLL